MISSPLWPINELFLSRRSIFDPWSLNFLKNRSIKISTSTVCSSGILSLWQTILRYIAVAIRCKLRDGLHPLCWNVSGELCGLSSYMCSSWFGDSSQTLAICYNIIHVSSSMVKVFSLCAVFKSCCLLHGDFLSIWVYSISSSMSKSMFDYPSKLEWRRTSVLESIGCQKVLSFVGCWGVMKGFKGI